MIKRRDEMKTSARNHNIDSIISRMRTIEDQYLDALDKYSSAKTIFASYRWENIISNTHYDKLIDLVDKNYDSVWGSAYSLVWEVVDNIFWRLPPNIKCFNKNCLSLIDK